jgi:hypothetical protein
MEDVGRKRERESAREMCDTHSSRVNVRDAGFKMGECEKGRKSQRGRKREGEASVGERGGEGVSLRAREGKRE